MKTRTAIVITNPHAGRGKAHARQMSDFCRALRARGIGAEMVETVCAGDATQIAARAAKEGATDLVVAGGDGTVNEALQGIVGSHLRLCVVPRGTANVLARELAVPHDLAATAEMILRGRTRFIHAGCAITERTNERRYFLLMAGIGLDASIVRGVHPRLKRRVGEAAFWYSGVEHLARWQPAPFNVEVAGETYTATFAAIGKAPRYGGNLSITPRACLDKPEFEICLVGSNSKYRYLRLLTHVVRAGLAEDTRGDVRFLRATCARATGDAPVQADGEMIGTLPARFEISPHRVEVIVP
ncbi:MAG: diacylglycerol kinase family lipid kinase [Pyrinomonadaceae bacterium]|nr:diacylglycerol kinase family lipid kinase [Pyrinomonadaceae bacterium]